jgi:hypothetical protein
MILFSVFLAHVFDFKNRSLENFGGIREVKTSFRKSFITLGIVDTRSSC